jgi:hypothetical protein
VVDLPARAGGLVAVGLEPGLQAGVGLAQAIVGAQGQALTTLPPGSWSAATRPWPTAPAATGMPTSMSVSVSPKLW